MTRPPRRRFPRGAAAAECKVQWNPYWPAGTIVEVCEWFIGSDGRPWLWIRGIQFDSVSLVNERGARELHPLTSLACEMLGSNP